MTTQATIQEESTFNPELFPNFDETQMDVARRLWDGEQVRTIVADKDNVPLSSSQVYQIRRTVIQQKNAQDDPAGEDGVSPTDADGATNKKAPQQRKERKPRTINFRWTWQKDTILGDPKTYDEETPMVYLADVPATHEADVPDRYIEDSPEDAPVEYKAGDVIMDADGEPVLLHKAGDALLGEDGNPVIAHKEGDPVLGEDGNQMNHEIGSPMVDADGQPVREDSTENGRLFMYDGASVIHIVTTENPHKPTGRQPLYTKPRNERYDLYTEGMTVQQYIDAGGETYDIDSDMIAGHITLAGENVFYFVVDEARRNSVVRIMYDAGTDEDVDTFKAVWAEQPWLSEEGEVDLEAEDTFVKNSTDGEDGDTDGEDDDDGDEDKDFE